MMIINPVKYFLKRYYASDLRPNELKWMLNLWFPFMVNRIQIISITEDFHKMNVRLKYSFWNQNPNKSIWGGSITSALDPFFPIMMKQLLLKRGIVTDFYSKAVNVKFIKMIKSNVIFHFYISEEEVTSAENFLDQNGKYDGWHSINGIDNKGNICVNGRVQIYLKRRR
jgi:hypothetical protein